MGPTVVNGVCQRLERQGATFSWSSTGPDDVGMVDDELSAPGVEAVSRTLPADLSSVRQARDVVRTTLVGWRADNLYEDVALVASELVSNALRHGLQLDRQAGPEPGDTVELSLRCDGDHVICAVTDPSQDPPIRRRGDVLTSSGRGLQLVDSLSLCWGWRVHDTKSIPAQGRGKSVWAAFPLRMAAAVGAA